MKSTTGKVACVLACVAVVCAGAAVWLWHSSRSVAPAGESGQVPSYHTVATPDPPALQLCGQTVAAVYHTAQTGAAARQPDWNAQTAPAAADCTTPALGRVSLDLTGLKNPAVQAAVYTSFPGGEQMFSGTLEQLAAFDPGRNGDFELIVQLAADYESGSGAFGGTAWYRVQLAWQAARQQSSAAQQSSSAAAQSSSQPQPSSAAAAASGPADTEQVRAAQQSAAAAPAITLEGVPLKQGGTALLRVTGVAAGQKVTAATDFKFTPRLFAYRGARVALIPAQYLLKTGKYTVTVTVAGKAYSKTFSIVDGGFETEPDPITVDISPSTDEQAANTQFVAATKPVKAEADAAKYWQGAFRLPLDGKARVTSSFGYTRTVNGAISRHSGMDLAAAEGAAVYAPAAGRVAYSGWLDLTGNTICIEHGFGLKSWFYHMSGRTVKTGDMVKKGDQIGKVGSTGIYTTGPHLHFGMTVFNVFVDPQQFMDAPLLN